MSAVNAFARPGAAYIVSDFATYYVSTGAVAEIRSKIVSSNKLRAAIGVNGWVPVDAYKRLSELLDECDSQADLLPRLAQLAAAFARQGPPDGQSAQGCLLAAVYMVDRPTPPPAAFAKLAPFGGVNAHQTAGEVWAVAVTDQSEPMQLPIYVRPLPDQPAWKDFGSGNARQTASQARQLIDVQRKITDDRGLHFVGGGVELVTVTAAGVRHQIVRRYHLDRPGKPIRPSWLDRIL